MNTVDCGAQFAMLRSIKLHGGKTVLNTIKAIKTGKSPIYINSKKTKPCKISRTAHGKPTQDNQTNLIRADF